MLHQPLLLRQASPHHQHHLHPVPVTYGSLVSEEQQRNAQNTQDKTTTEKIWVRLLSWSFSVVCLLNSEYMRFKESFS